MLYMLQERSESGRPTRVRIDYVRDLVNLSALTTMLQRGNSRTLAVCATADGGPSAARLLRITLTDLLIRDYWFVWNADTSALAKAMGSDCFSALAWAEEYEAGRLVRVKRKHRKVSARERLVAAVESGAVTVRRDA